MKVFYAAMITGLTLMGMVGAATAQQYGGRDYGYGERDGGYRDRGRDDRGRDDRDRGYESRERRGDSRGGDSRDRQNAFDDRDYLRCNPDVRQALRNGQITSALAHYQKFGRREGRRLSC